MNNENYTNKMQMIARVLWGFLPSCVTRDIHYKAIDYSNTLDEIQIETMIYESCYSKICSTSYQLKLHSVFPCVTRQFKRS